MNVNPSHFVVYNMCSCICDGPAKKYQVIIHCSRRVGGNKKASILLTNVDQKLSETVFDCHLSPNQKHCFSDFDPRSSIVKSVFDCRPSDVLLSILRRLLRIRSVAFVSKVICIWDYMVIFN